MGGMTKPEQEGASPPAPAADTAPNPAPAPAAGAAQKPKPASLPPEIGGPAGPEPTRFGDWERKGRVSDF
ncbi:DUF1674 domain-containing protein [Pseudoroseomonas cervicalis]|uniref:DUF1674 domain-containing protein n=1 Tax=Teichococcus cervicalis TaxID=204525 RepID=UPI00278840E9|nr:DUF1674 domain-containing protein [Pseudoroseomonas cervicalis]MDQ1081201.1 hypothetical protein [Pseudoroseomonas cervicalis]